MAEHIARPDEVPRDIPLAELAEAYFEHTGRLVRADAGIGDPLSDDARVRHAISALAIQHAIADRALQGRWVNARDALRAGATREQVAQAMGLEADEVSTGLRWWAEGQHRLAWMTDEQRAEVERLTRDETSET